MTGPDHVRFPPRWRNILLPAQPRSATAVGIGLWTASRPVPVLAQQAAWLLARTVGARALPGPREPWAPPTTAATWDELWRAWTALTGRSIDGVAVFERLQPERARVTLMLCAGRSSLLVRLRRERAELDTEWAMSRAAQHTHTFGVPAGRGRGQTGGWHWSAYAAISARPHRPRYRVDDAVLREVRTLVEAVVTRPAGTPAHWRGAHGDIVPWNLRRAAGRTWLLDWEDAGWAPPGTDRVYHSAVLAALGRRAIRPLTLPAGHEEARERLLGLVAGRAHSDAELRLHRRLLVALGGG